MRKSLGLLWLAAAATAAAAELPPTPFTAWDIDFESETAGNPPSRSSVKDSSLPIKKISHADFVTTTRYPKIENAPTGFATRALTLVFTETNQPHWGPRLFVNLPNPCADAAEHLTLTLECAKNAVTRVGGFSLDGVCEINFTDAGDITVNQTKQIGRYQARIPVKFEFGIDNRARTVTVSTNSGPALTLPWKNPHMGGFNCIRLDGLLPGGYARDPGSIAFDNLKLTVNQWRKK